jgi:hypothetical protein
MRIFNKTLFVCKINLFLFIKCRCDLEVFIELVMYCCIEQVSKLAIPNPSPNLLKSLIRNKYVVDYSGMSLKNSRQSSVDQKSWVCGLGHSAATNSPNKSNLPSAMMWLPLEEVLVQALHEHIDFGVTFVAIRDL